MTTVEEVKVTRVTIPEEIKNETWEGFDIYERPTSDLLYGHVFSLVLPHESLLCLILTKINDELKIFQKNKAIIIRSNRDEIIETDLGDPQKGGNACSVTLLGNHTRQDRTEKIFKENLNMDTPGFIVIGLSIIFMDKQFSLKPWTVAGSGFENSRLAKELHTLAKKTQG